MNSKALREYARRTFPDSHDRLLFQLQYFELSCRMHEIGFSVRKTAADADSKIAQFTKRKRGEKTKLTGAQMLEEIAVSLVRARVRQLKQIGVPAFEIWNIAREEIAPYFEITAATLENWQRGVPRRERERPIDERSHARRKRFPKRD